jgi:N-acetylglucosamine-6-phosphate deacetylase
MTILCGASVLTPNGLWADGWVQVEDDCILEVGTGVPPPGVTIDLGGHLLVPGFIDVHCHGACGHDFGTGTADEVLAIADFHLSHGSTGMLASLAAAPLPALCRQLSVIADVVESGRSQILGSHLEGPFLSQAKRGAQNPAHLLAPDSETLMKLIGAARGTLRMITIAPELPGALALMGLARAAGVVVAVGHTDASYDEAMAAFRHGASAATHLCNGMRAIGHREPGPVLAALEAGAACEVISDGLHVHEWVPRLVAQHDPRQLVLITDAMSATGQRDGPAQLGGQDVTVVDGRATLTATGSLAGSTLTMDVAVRRTVLAVGLPLDVTLAAASANPARLLGVGESRGAIAPGFAADLVLLDGELAPIRVMRHGRWAA